MFFSTDDLCVSYGHIRALQGIQIEVREGEIVGVIGANGAGKSTLLRTIMGLLTPIRGSIVFQDEDITRIPTEKRVARGFALVPEGRRIFRSLTVRENLEIGAFQHRSTISTDIERIFAWFPRLRERASQYGYSLSGGEQQMLAIARALMSRPRLLMIDEPSLGLAPALVDEVYAHIQEINARGVTILLVEQNARGALELAKRAYVFENGKVVMGGLAEELRQQEQVKSAFLGI